MKRALAAIAATILVAACGSAAATNSTTSNSTAAKSTGSTVNATLQDDFKIVVDKTTLPAGSVTFHVTNAGKVPHELVLLKTDLAYDRLPPDPDEAGKIVEDNGSSIIHVDETDNMDGGGTKNFTVDLAAGKYVLVCDEPGHYASGMRLPFIVQ